MQTLKDIDNRYTNWLHRRRIKQISKQVPHNCVSCNWFKMRPLPEGAHAVDDSPNLTRVCMNPRPFTWKDWNGNQCLHWIIADDIEKRSLDIYGVVR